VPQAYSQEKLDQVRVEGEWPYRNIYDSLVMDAKEAIPDISVYEYIKLVSEHANAIGDSSDGNMYRYQETFMDEKDLAENSFRQRAGRNQSLEEFTQEDSEEGSLYDLYRKYQEKQAAGEPLTELEKSTKAKLDEARMAGKMREL